MPQQINPNPSEQNLLIALFGTRVQIRDKEGQFRASFSIAEAFELAVWVREHAFVLDLRERDMQRDQEAQQKGKDA